jgi:hypothetical protein
MVTRGDVDVGRFDIRALETNVVDMKAHVHEFSVQVDEWEVGIQRQFGGQLDYAHQHQGSYFTCSPGNSQDHPRDDTRACYRQDCPPQGFPLGCAERQAAFAQRSGNSCQAFFGCHNNRWQRKQGQRQRGPE